MISELLLEGIRQINFILILCLELNKAIHNAIEPFWMLLKV